jgi:hypothetical protein
MSDPCLSCQLPSCDEDHPGCAYREQQRTKKRSGNAERVRRYQQSNPLTYHVSQILWQREQRIRRTVLAVRGAA